MSLLSTEHPGCLWEQGLQEEQNETCGAYEALGRKGSPRTVQLGRGNPALAGPVGGARKDTGLSSGPLSSSIHPL